MGKCPEAAPLLYSGSKVGLEVWLSDVLITISQLAPCAREGCWSVKASPSLSPHRSPCDGCRALTLLAILCTAPRVKDYA